MLSVAEALERIVETVTPLPAEDVPLGDALGRVLAVEIVSGIDSPPFDKSLMDGFAVRAADLVDGRATLGVLETVTAGNLPTQRVEPGTATRIMTGAPLPDGADAVVRIEDTRFDEATGRVTIATRPVEPGNDVIARGTNTHVGETVLSPGCLLRPQELGTLAELGCATVDVFRRPRVAVLATGDELVPVAEMPGPGQIRNSNETMLVAQLRRMGADPVPLGIARDDRAHLREGIEWGLACDVLLLSGGVSAGMLDLVPSELAAAGVVELFHKVNVKPGKPLWFGVRMPRAEPRDVLNAVRAELRLQHGESAEIEVQLEPLEPRIVVDGRALDSTELGELLGRAAARSATESMRHAIADTEPRPCWVFGLPGNPVSSMVCAELFARTAIRRAMGLDPAVPTTIPGRLAHDHTTRGDRPVYHPAHIEWTAHGARVHLVPWHGSSDLRATVAANGLALIPAGNATHPVGTIVETMPLETY